MTTRRVIVTRASRLFDASLAVLAEWRARDPFAPILAVATSGTVARALVRGAALPGGVAAGIRGTTLHGLARSLVEPFEHRLQLPRHADRLVVADLLDRDPGPLGVRAGRPAVAAAVARTLGDLRQVGIDILDASNRRDLLEGAGDLLHRREYRAFEHLVRLSDKFSDWLARAELYDDAMLYALARNGKLASPAPRVLVHGVYDVTGSQRELLDHLLPALEATWVMPVAPEESASAEIVRTTLAWIRAKGFALEGFDETPLSPLPEPRFVSAAGGRAEAREVVRGLLTAAAAGVPFGDMAVLVASPRAQMAFFEEELARAGVPVTGGSAESLAEMPVGRIMLAILAILADEADSDQVAAVIGHAAEREQGSGLTGAAALSLARQAGCFEADEAHWRGRLLGFAASQRWRAERVDDERANFEDGAEELREQADRAEAIAGVATTILARISGVGRALAECEARRDAAAAWQRFGDLIATIASMAGLRDGDLHTRDLFAAFGRSGVTFRTDHALQLVRELIGEQASVARDDPPPDHEPPGDEDAAPRSEAELGAGAGRRRLGEAVLLVDLNRARGLRTERSWCAGLADDLFASPTNPDPVLSDFVRRKIAAASGMPLRTSTRRAEEAELLFAFGVAAGRESITLSWPRADDESGRARYPADPAVRVIGSEAAVQPAPRSAPALSESSRPLLDDHEYDVAALASGEPALWAHLQEREEFTAARRVHAARFMSRELTPYDGITGPPAAGETVFSPSALQRIAECPFHYFLRDRLGLRRLPDEWPTAAPDRLEVGRVAHDVLQELFAPLVGRDPRGGPGAADLVARVPGLVTEGVLRARQQGAAGAPSLWAGTARALAASLAPIVVAELDALVSEGRRVVELEREHATGLKAGSVTLTLRGRPDRVDHAPGGSLVVTDYKYSNGSRLPDGRKSFLKGGTQLQLPVYAHLLAQDRRQAGGAVLRIVLLTAVAGKTIREYDLATAEGSEGSLELLVERVVGFVSAGDTFQVPDQRAKCGFCEFDAFCGPGKERIAARKSGDPRREDHARLVLEFP